MESLKEIVINLIKSQKEGNYWDFKANYGENIDLVHDIICLSNTTHHKGTRYLIIGISEDTSSLEKYTVSGITGSEKQQSDIIDLLRDRFADVPPDVSLHKLDFNGKMVDVIIINDSNRKPYYLKKIYKEKGKCLYPGTIYTRVQDTNTPKDCVANTVDVESMWRQRFGLDLSGLDKLRYLMADKKKWDKTQENFYFHTIFPEYNIEFEFQDNSFSEIYSLYYPNNKSFSALAKIRLYQLNLILIDCVTCDEMRIRFPVPDTHPITLNNQNGFFYYFLKDSDKWRLFNIISAKDHTFKSRGSSEPPFLLFKNIEELNKFLIYLYHHESSFNDIDISQSIHTYNYFSQDFYESQKHNIEFMEKIRNIFYSFTNTLNL